MKPELYLNVAGRLGADKTLAKPCRRADILRAIEDILS